MKFIITDFFERQFSKIVQELNITELVQKINVNSKNFINLKDPYIKIKLRTKSKSYRIIIIYDKIDFIILFVNIFDKKDKNYGENLNWDLHKNDIISWKNKNQECIIEGNYKNIFL